MIQRVLTATLILLALAGAVVGHQATANSGGPLVVVSDEDDGECEDGDNSGSGSSNSGSGGGDECEDEDDDSGRGRGRGGNDDDGDGAVPPGAGADAPAADEVVVRIVDRGFSPANVTVAPGQTVTFVNEDDDEHTATGDRFDTGTIPPGNSATVTFDAAGAFDTGRLDEGQSGSVTFDEPGTFAYHCEFHPEMVGTIVVR